ncbi:MAG: YidC/Oxa1 family insertase periplasmic-domain containing protein, partial [Phycisphaerae bacterium]|nr:YidC/Oxa1 family insertase periplasmic-domain containing protein [Phycisphaerae bacterium]
MLILFGWDFVSQRIWPPPKPAQTENKAPVAVEPLRQPRAGEAAKTPVPAPPRAAEKIPEPEPAKAPAVEGVTEVAKVEQPASPLIPKLVPAVVEKSGLVMLGSAATGSAYDVAAVVDPVDAAIRSITLTKFFKTAKDKDQPDREKLQLIQPLDGRRSLAISELAIWDKAHGTEPVEADISGAVWEYAREGSSAWEAVFKLVLRQGEKDFLEIKKTFSVAPRKRMPDTEDEKTEDGRYEVSMQLRFRDLSGQIEHLQYALAGPAGLPREGVRSDLRHVVMGKWEKKVIVPSIAPAVQIAKSQETFVKKWREENPGRNWEEPLPAVDVDTGDIVWAGSDDKYFAVVVVPMADKVDEFDDARISVVTADTYPDMTPWGEGPAGQPYLLMRKSAFADARTNGVIENSFLIFAGPKEESLLEKQYSRYNLPALIIWSRGCCGAIPGIHHISKFMVGVINAFTLFTFNHGLSIILVVVLLRLVLHPITRWSQKSMIKMQKLAPLIQELKASCGDDKRRLQQETMVLYKEHGVNPIGGCLPMVIQMPIWIGLYGGLMVAISLRQAPFLAWI